MGGKQPLGHSDHFSYNGGSGASRTDRPGELEVAADDFADYGPVEEFLGYFDASMPSSARKGSRGRFEVTVYPQDNFSAALTTVRYQGENVSLGRVDWNELKQSLQDSGFKTKI